MKEQGKEELGYQNLEGSINQPPNIPQNIIQNPIPQNPPNVFPNINIPDDNVFYENRNMNDDIEEEINNRSSDEERMDLDEERKYENISNAFMRLPNQRKYKPIGEAQKKLIGKKREKKKARLKELQIELQGKERKSKPEPTKLQVIFNKVMKSGDFSKNNIISSAGQLQYNIDDDSIKLLVELGKAKASIKKVGIPTNICKKKLHMFTFIKLFKELSIITDDKIVWECYLGSQFLKDNANKDLIKYMDLKSGLSIKFFSIVSNEVFKNEKAISGYCQDELKYVALINEGNLKQNDLNDFLQRAQADALAHVTNSVLPNGKAYNYYANNTMIVCIPTNYNLQEFVNRSKNVKLVNTKTNLVEGLKTIKVNNEIGTYLSLHEIKLTDFSPACLFVSPFKNFKTFLSMELDYNVVYDYLKLDNVREIRTLDLPPDCIFWDNIGSFIELLGLIKITKRITDELSKSITELIELYNKYKFAFAAWKNVYNSFESLILRFYDSVTTRLTLDGTTRMKEKVSNFLSNYYILKNHSSYKFVGDILTRFSSNTMMRNFFSQTAAHDTVSAIDKIITILMTRNTSVLENQMTLEEMFRTTAIMCLECLYDGYVPMIPKVRAKASFLGGVSNENVSDDNLRQNIANIVRLFAESIEKKQDQYDPSQFIQEKEKYDNIIDKVLDNTFKNPSVKETADAIGARLKAFLKTNPISYKSMIDDITGFMADPDYNEAEMLAYGDFSDNPDVMGFINRIVACFKGIKEVADECDHDKIFKAVKINKNKKTPRLFKKSLGRNKNKRAAPTLQSFKNNAITIDGKELLNSINKLSKGFEDKNVKKIVDAMNKEMAPLAGPLVIN